MSGYYLALDMVQVVEVAYPAGITVLEADRGSLKWNTSYGERYYWNGAVRTWHGAVELAELFQTVEEAESQAVIAVALDCRVTGHVRIVPEQEALSVEAKNIESRRLRNEEYGKFEHFRHRLSPNEGGVI